MNLLTNCLICTVIKLCCVQVAPGGTAQQDDSKKQKPFSHGPLEFKRTDEALWHHCYPFPEDQKESVVTPIPYQIFPAEIDLKFVPLAYFKGSPAEREKQKAINDKTAAFIAKHLKGKRIWIDETQPMVFAGPGQILGIIWLDKHRKKSLQELLIDEGLATKKRQR